MSTGTQIEVVMPQMGVSVSEGTITKWLKQPGEAIARDEPLLEISTDKVDTEVPSPGDGVLQEILVSEGQTVDVGTVVGRIGPAGSEAVDGRLPRSPRRPRLLRPSSLPPTPRSVVAAPPASTGTGTEPADACSPRLRPQRLSLPLPSARRTAGDDRQRTSVRLPRRRAHRCRARRRSHGRRWHRHRRPRHEEGHPRVHRVGRRPRP